MCLSTSVLSFDCLIAQMQNPLAHFCLVLSHSCNKLCFVVLDRLQLVWHGSFAPIKDEVPPSHARFCSQEIRY